MAFVLKFIKTVRTNWKKSTFLAIAVSYGVNYSIEYYQTQDLMRTYCLEAKKYGDEKIPDGTQPKNITVILNPSANRRKATKQFENYCAPILHLAGICVDVLQTDSEGHARKLVENLKQTDAIIVAGGDGTVSEVITGLFRRTNNDRIVNPCPIGILPLGRTNTIGRFLFPGGETLAVVKSLVDASMAVVENSTKVIDVMKIEIKEETKSEGQNLENNTEAENKINEKKEINDKNNNDNTEKSLETENKSDNVAKETDKTDVEEKLEESSPKPVYALASFEWGAYRDAHAKEDKYWYWGSLRKYATYIFNGYKKNLTWQCNADVMYLEPCPGCSNCYVPPENNKTNTRWWSRFFSKPAKVEEDYSKIINERCGQQHHREIVTSDLTLTTINTFDDPGSSQLCLNIGPHSTEYFTFVKEGFKTLKGENRNIVDKIEARQVEIVPKKLNPEQEIWFSIDKEEYEVRPVKITLLPHVLKVFCRQENKNK